MSRELCDGTQEIEHLILIPPLNGKLTLDETFKLNLSIL